MKQDKKRHNLYLPEILYQQIKHIAEEQERSFNRQCIFLLARAVEHERLTVGNDLSGEHIGHMDRPEEKTNG